MKILFYLFAGNGDLINTTGIIKIFKEQYPHAEIDFLLKPSQKYLLKNNQYLNKVFTLEDFGLVFSGKDPRALDNEVEKTLPSYDHYINMWTKKYQGDFPTSKVLILKDAGFPLSYNRKDINGILYPDESDFQKVDAFIDSLGDFQNKKVVLIEDESFNAHAFNVGLQLQQLENQKQIANELLGRGFIVLSNNLPSTISVKDLSLIQTKILFEKIGDIFLGLSSGMTTVFFTEGNYKNKMFIISGRPEWNYCKHINGMEKYAYYKNYTWETLNADFRIFDRSTKCCELENVECARSAL
jgi:hypothetical protein